MRVGYLGGSFDPPTVAHMHLAQTVSDHFNLDKVVLGLCSNKRPDKSLASEDVHRLAMLEISTRDNPIFSIDSFEMNQEASKVFSYFTMEHIKSLYPQAEVYFIMGADVLISLAEGSWDYGRELVENNQFIVMSRDHKNLEGVLDFYPFIQPYKSKFHLLQLKEDIRVSSTYLRSEIKSGQIPRYLLPHGVSDYIKEHRLYL